MEWMPYIQAMTTHPYYTFFNDGMEYPRIQKSTELKAKKDGDEDEDEERRGDLAVAATISPARELPLFPFPGFSSTT